MTNADMLKIQLQTLQFQNDVTGARIALVQALNTLRELIGFDSVPRDYDIVGQLAYTTGDSDIGGVGTRASRLRPDLEAAQRGVLRLRKARSGWPRRNAKQDLNVTFDYTHVSAANLAAFYFRSRCLSSTAIRARWRGPITR